MRTRAVVAAIPAVLLACTAPASAQAPARPSPAGTARIGMLCLTTCDPAGFPVVEELRRLGWVEGRNLAVERRAAEGRAERLPGLATELVRLRPDVLVAATPQTALAAKDATASIPVVFASVADPVGVGLVRDLARPGGNVTGVATMVPDANVAEAFGIIRELLPGARRVAAFVNPGNAVARRLLAEQAPAASRQFGLVIEVVEVSTSDQVPGAIAGAKQRGADALSFVGDAIFHTPPERVPGLVAAAGLPAMYLPPALARAGGLIAYGPDFGWIVRRQAEYVDRVLRGASPAELPVERPTRYTLVVNLRAADALGLAVPPAILAAADEVID
jgi:putative ABC transport system substrate-binding protein